MNRFIRISWFHLKIFAQNSYFLSLMLTGTITLFLIEYITITALDGTFTEATWLRAGIFGLWSCGTTAAGSIGFQRFQGTLLYLINNRYSDQLSLASVILPAASFGLLCFPVAYCLALVFSEVQPISLELLITIGLLWMGALVLDFLIASIFVLTKHAIAYEDLLTLPLLFLSGLFPLPAFLERLSDALNWVLPIALPIKWLLKKEAMTSLSIVQFLVALAISFSLSYLISGFLLQEAKKSGQLGGVL